MIAKNIKLLALDIDGVFTDGTVYLIQDREAKQIHYHDLDAVNYIIKHGIEVVFVTGEDSEFVDELANRCGVTCVFKNSKDKYRTLVKVSNEYNVSLSKICYVGDSDRDAPAISAAGLGIAPLNSTPLAMSTADIVLKTTGGTGAVAEVVRILLDKHKAK